MSGYLLIDGSNVLFASVSGRTLRCGDQETQGIFGFLKVLRAAMIKFPTLRPIILWDGLSWRKAILDGYKASRDVEAPTTKSEHMQNLMRASFKSQRPILRKGLRHLAVTQLSASNLEADDLAGMLVPRYAAQGKKVVMLSGDKDWIQLVRPNVGWMDPIARSNADALKLVTMVNFEAKMGVKTPAAYLEVKALMGDISDEISGVGGIGEKGALELVNTYGSVADFLNRTIDGSLPKLPKKFADFGAMPDKHNIYRRNIMLMDLCNASIPKPIGLYPDKGCFNTEGFEAFCDEWMFQSFLIDTTWMEPFERNAQ